MFYDENSIHKYNLQSTEPIMNLLTLFTAYIDVPEYHKLSNLCET